MLLMQVVCFFLLPISEMHAVGNIKLFVSIWRHLLTHKNKRSSAFCHIQRIKSLGLIRWYRFLRYSTFPIHIKKMGHVFSFLLQTHLAQQLTFSLQFHQNQVQNSFFSFILEKPFYQRNTSLSCQSSTKAALKFFVLFVHASL